MSFARKLPALLAVLGLAGCGFHPLYGSRGGQPSTISARMDQIDIGLMPDRSGQVMREALERDLQRAGAPNFYRYHLVVHYGISVQVIGIQPDSSNTRNRFFANAHWVLTPEGNRNLAIVKGNAHAMDAENIIDNQYFATALDGGVMRHRLAREIATQITTQLAIYFHNHPAKG